MSLLPTHLHTAQSRMSWILLHNSCTPEAAIIPPSAPCREAIVSTAVAQVWEISCSMSKVASTAELMPVWKSETLISPLIGRFHGGVIRWQRNLECKCCWVTGKAMNQLRHWHLPACGTGRSNAPAWHHNLWELMPGTSCSLKFRKWVLTECRKTEEIEEGMSATSSNNASNSGVLMQSLRIELRLCSTSLTAWSGKE